MIYATAGHVDHGKTSLIKSLTSVETDRLPEEKLRGLSIELGFAYSDLADGGRVGFVDVPGHERFIRTMVSGVGSIDAVLFVVALDDGPMPQTLEHLHILELMGVTKGVIIYTKSDRVTEIRKAQVRRRVQEVVSYSFLANCREFFVSTKTGEGMEELKSFIDSNQSLSRPNVNRLFRLAVDRSFALKGVGKVITGSIFSGEVEVGQFVRHLPSGARLRIRKLHAQGQESSSACVGQRCAVNISGSELGKIKMKRGDWLVSEFQSGTSERLHANVFSLKGEIFKDGMPIHFHLGASDTTGRLFLCDKNQSAQERTAFLVLNKDIHSVKGDRFVLRDQAAEKTIGGGVVCDPSPAKNLTRVQRFHLIKQMQSANLDKVLKNLLNEGCIGLDADRFRRVCNLTDLALKDILKSTAVLEIKSDSTSFLVSSIRWEETLNSTLNLIKKFHDAKPNLPGITFEQIYKFDPKLRKATGQKLMGELLRELIRRDLLSGIGGLYKLKKFFTKASGNLERNWPPIFEMLSKPVANVPVVQDLSEALGMSKVELEKCLKEAVVLRTVVKISEKRYFLPEAVQDLREQCVSIAEECINGRFTVRDFRDKSGIGRNAVVEILEYFDREQFTLRQGNHRVLRR